MLNRNIQLFLVIASSILSLVATDIILPSLPQMALFFAVPYNTVKMLISIFMVGQFTTVLIWGVVADQIGRRKTLGLGMFVFFLGSILSLMTTSINVLLAGRLLQGAGAVVVPVAGWALVQDLFPRDDSARVMAWIGTIIAVVPLFAPAIGGQIDVLYGWHANLYCIAAYSSALFMLMIFLPQQKNALPPPASLTLKTRINIYSQILKNKTFVSYISLFGLLNCGEWCFLTVAPFYYTHVQISPDQMGILLMLTSIGFVCGSFLASTLIKRYGVDNTIRVGIQLALISSLLLLLGEYAHWSHFQLFNALDIAVYIMSSALLWGGTTSRALQCFAQWRGAASAIRSLILLCFASFGTYVGRLLSHTSLYPIGLFLFLTALSAFFVFHNKELKAVRLSGEAAY
jgi:DHA1 family bicyclomycin/chloramphenicol resistance-like MFS transporter